MPNPNFIELSELLRQGRPSSFPVAATGYGPRSWEDFIRACAAWRGAFEAHPERRWALYTEDSWRFATALFGALSADRHPVVVGDASPETCIRLAAEVDGFAGDFKSGHGKTLLTNPGNATGETAFPSLSSSQSTLTLYTSGSTGHPLAIPKKLDQLAAEIRCLEDSFGEAMGQAQILATVSHQHIYGLLFKILWPLCAGRMIETRQLFYPEEILDATQGISSAVLIASPAHLKRLPEEASWKEALPVWRAVFSSGGPLSWVAAKSSASRFGKDVNEIYGSSETGGIAWRKRDREDAPWTPLSHVELEIEEGRLKLRSPHLPDTAWFLTSDKAELGPDRSFRLLGRQDRIVKVEEKRISLDAIEAALIASGLAKEARVFPLDGQRVELAAVAIPSAQGDALLNSQGKHALNLALREAAAQRIERVGLPRRWRYVEAFPSDSQGKVTHTSLLALFREKDL